MKPTYENQTIELGQIETDLETYVQILCFDDHAKRSLILQKLASTFALLKRQPLTNDSVRFARKRILNTMHIAFGSLPQWNAIRDEIFSLFDPYTRESHV